MNTQDQKLDRILNILIWVLIILITLATGSLARCQESTRDDGFGDCPAFSHRHPMPAEVGLQPDEDDAVEIDQNGIHVIKLDGKCYDDDDHPLPSKERKKLPVPQRNKHLTTS